MTALRDKFIPSEYPGYFWNKNDKKLYSNKSGILKPLKEKKYFYQVNDITGPYYNIYVNGKNKTISSLNMKNYNWFIYIQWRWIYDE